MWEVVVWKQDEEEVGVEEGEWSKRRSIVGGLRGVVMGFRRFLRGVYREDERGRRGV